MTRITLQRFDMKNNARNDGHCPLAPPSQDPVMVAIHARLERVVRFSAQANVLIRGETGVGKEILAETLHRLSNRADKPFVIVNCAALTDSLFERELFGSKKGAYTDAKADEPGYFECAEGGTLLLDEIGELPRVLQAKLLRIVEERRVFRIGDPTPRPMNVRIVAATNQNIEVAMEKGLFRSDLYHRLNAVEFHIPPLRRRPVDILPLAEYLLDHESRVLGVPNSPRLSSQTMKCLAAYDYPGNVRELKQALVHAILECPGDVIEPIHLPQRMLISSEAMQRDHSDDRRSRRGMVEGERIRWALIQTAGNQTRAARLLDMSLRTFVSRLEEYGIPRPKKSAAHLRRPAA